MNSVGRLAYTIDPGGELSGVVRVPGDKSISHRAIILGSLAEGVTNVSGFLDGEDTHATLNAFRQMGVSITCSRDGNVTIQGTGMNGLQQPDRPLDLGNSGTSMRLLSGLLAGQEFDVTLVGDASLSGRPMRRITEPLEQMGAKIETTERGTAPLKIKGSGRLVGIDYKMPVASAQVKSCLLLAGLYADGETCIVEPVPTRDHTERMLRGYGYPLSTTGEGICIRSGGTLTAYDQVVPGDISSAAFFMVGATIADGSDITLPHVGVNQTRDGVIQILRLMGADIALLDKREVGGEPVADLQVRSARLKGIRIPEALVPLAIDEFPAIFIAAACAEGTTTLTGAGELRVKESDRIMVMADGLSRLGIEAVPQQDGIVIQGGQIGSGNVESHGDHRVAMSFAMAALRADGEIVIDDCENVSTSFPGFVEVARGAGLAVMARNAG